MPAPLPSLELLLTCSTLMGGVTAFAAHHYRGRRLLPWFILGFCFGCFALLTLFLLPKLKSLSEPQPVTLVGPIASGVAPQIVPSEPLRQPLWYFLNAQHLQQGPITFDELKRKYLQQEISEETYVWNEDLEDWKRLRELPDGFNTPEEPTS